jgi:hypothetical protein
VNEDQAHTQAGRGMSRHRRGGAWIDIQRDNLDVMNRQVDVQIGDIEAGHKLN